MRAEARIENMIGQKAGRQHLLLVRRCKIEVRLAVLIRRQPKLSGDIGTHLVAAGLNARTDGGVDVGRIAAVKAGKLPNRCADNLARGASPASMDGGHSAGVGIQQKNGNTIRRANADRQPGLICDDRVSFRLAVREAVGLPDDSGMYLTESYGGNRIGVARTEAVILPNEAI